MNLPWAKCHAIQYNKSIKNILNENYTNFTITFQTNKKKSKMNCSMAHALLKHAWHWTSPGVDMGPTFLFINHKIFFWKITIIEGPCIEQRDASDFLGQSTSWPFRHNQSLPHQESSGQNSILSRPWEQKIAISTWFRMKKVSSKDGYLKQAIILINVWISGN